MPTEIIVWDVQHGNSITVKTPDGKYIWCDAGTGSFDNGEEFSPYIHMKCPQIDLLVLSHPHDDHLGDFWNIPYGRINYLLYNSFLSQHYFEALRDSTTTSFRAKKTLSKYFVLQKNLKCGRIAQFHMPQDQQGLPLTVYAYWAISNIGENINNYSIVLYLHQGSNIICLPGDIEGSGWEQLRKSYYPSFQNLLKKTNILVASHHGRQKGWYSDFTTLCNPEIVVISDSDEKETSITSAYDNITKGHSVYKRNILFPPPVGRPIIKKCVSTRDNGPISITLGDKQFSVRVQKGI